MKIVSKIAASFLVTFMVLGSTTAYYLLSLELGAVQILLFQRVMIIFASAMAVLGILIGLIILHPLKKLAKVQSRLQKVILLFRFMMLPSPKANSRTPMSCHN